MRYPEKMRARALEAVRKGHTKSEVRELYGLGINTLRDWEKLKAETGSLSDKRPERTAYKIGRDKLLEYYRQNPFSTNRETAIAFGCSVSGIRSAKKVLGITRKKTQFNTSSEMSRRGKNLSQK